SYINLSTHCEAMTTSCTIIQVFYIRNSIIHLNYTTNGSTCATLSAESMVNYQIFQILKIKSHEGFSPFNKLILITGVLLYSVFTFVNEI
ncbi:MAG: hypothetical protein KAI34_01170, partial [Candidatus Lokiarchaeota archaeon]|nr:hypothetical protein [Candidatus Lokiarchaeota archaeon]